MNTLVRKLSVKVLSISILALQPTIGCCGVMGAEAPVSPGKVYVGAFAGAGWLSSGDLGQYGTSYKASPLAVNAIGKSEGSSMGLVGGHFGFAGPSNLGVHFQFTPAIELEAYYVGDAKLVGHDLDNYNPAIAEHDFYVKYPLRTGVFLVNGVLNANNNVIRNLKPYVGFGIGSAVVSVKGALAIQTTPFEPSLIHYNTDPNDTAVGFAAQPKIGLRYEVNTNTSVFAEYRLLYLSETQYTFGSTIATGHPATSPWHVKFKSQYYNMGTIGVDFDV